MALAHVLILGRAYEAIKDCTEEYICHAVQRQNPHANLEHVRDIQCWIQDVLDSYDCCSYEGYLSREHYDLYMCMGREDEIEGRLAWIVWMQRNHTIFNGYSTK